MGQEKVVQPEEQGRTSSGADSDRADLPAPQLCLPWRGRGEAHLILLGLGEELLDLAGIDPLEPAG